MVTPSVAPTLTTSATANDSAFSTPPAAASTICLNKQRYLVREKLSDTLYGAVWLCEDAHHGHDVVAIKQVVLHKAEHALRTISRHIDNPWTERRIMAQLAQLGRHDNILYFRHEFVEHGAWYVVMDYCTGGDLLNVLQHAPGHRLTQIQAMPLFADIVEGVRFLHANGIAHRDLSLENVLLQGNTPKLCDFGLITETNRLCTDRVGKAYYMAPEVIAQEAYDPAAADMWSLGILLFIMLTGSPLMPSASENEKAFQALKKFGVQAILQVWEMESDMSAAVIDLLHGLLQVNSAKRYTIEDVAHHPALHFGY